MKKFRVFTVVIVAILFGTILSFSEFNPDSHKSLIGLNIEAVVSADEGDLQCWNTKCTKQNGTQGSYQIYCGIGCSWYYTKGTTGTCNEEPPPVQ